MACLFLEGFDHYNSNTFFGLKGWAAVGMTFPAGRFGGNSATLGNGTSRALPTPKTTLIIGFALKMSSLGNPYLVQFTDGGTTQVDLRVTSLGALQVTRNGTQLDVSDNGLIVVGVWNYLEFKATIDNTAGVYAVRLNGFAPAGLPDASSQDTQYTANSSCNSISLSSSGNGQMIVDDLYCFDDSGSANNDFAGDSRIETILPAGGGGVTQWTPSAGSNWQNVDDAPNPNDDTDYNKSKTADQIDTFVYGDITGNATAIHAVQYSLYARKDDAGARTIAPVSRQGGTDYPWSSVTLPSSYRFFSEVKDQNPATSSAWTAADINTNSEFGYKLVS